MKIVGHIILSIRWKKSSWKKNISTFTHSIFIRENQKGNTAINGTTAVYIIILDVFNLYVKKMK